MEGASDAQEAETITLRVKTLPDGCHTVTIAPSAKIVDLKASLLDIVGIPVDRQRLIFHGRALSDDSVLASVGLEDGNTLHLVERPAGAAPPGAGSDRPSQGPDLQQILQSVMSGGLPPNAHVTLSTSTMPNAMPAHMASLLGGSSIGEPPGRRLHTRMGEDAARAGLNREWLALPEVLSNFQDHLASGPPVQRASPDNPAPAGSPSPAEAGAASAPPPPPGEAASGTEARRGGEEPDRAPFMFPLDGRHPAGPMDARSSTAVESLLLAAVRQLQGMQRLPDELEAMRDRALQELAQLPPPDSATRTERYPSSSPSPQPAPGASSGSAGEASAPAASEAAAVLPAGSAGTARRWAEPASGPGRYLRNYDCSVLLAAVAARHVKRTHDLITRHLLPQLLHHSDVVMPMASAALEERRLQAAASGDAQPQTSGSSGGQAEAAAPAVADGSLPSEHLRPWEQAGDAGARQRASGTAAAEQQPAPTAAARLELEPRRDALARQMEVVGTAVHRYGALLMELAHELARVRTLLRAGSHAQESAAARSFGAAMPAFLEQDGREVLTTTMRPRITAASGSAGRTGGGALGRMLSVLPGAVLGMLGAPGARTVESGGLSFSLSGPQPAADSASSPSAPAAGATAAAARSDDGPPEASAGAREGAGLAAAPAPHRSEMQGAPAAPAPASGGGGGDGDAGADDRTLAPGSAAEPEEQSGGPADGGAGAAQWTADGLFQVYSAPIGLSSTPGMLEALSELLDIGDRAVQPPEVDSAGASDAERLAAQGAGLGGAARDILRALSSVMPSHSAIDGQDQPGVPRLVSGLVHVVSLGRARNAQEIAVLRDACERSIPRAAHALQQHLALGEGERASELPLLRLLAAIPALLPQLLSIVQESMLAAGQAAGLPEQRVRELFGVPPEGDLRRPRFLDGLLSLLPLIAQMMPWISPGACPPARPESQEGQQPEAGAEETAVAEEGPAAAEGRSLANLEDDLKAALERISVLEEQLAEKRTAAGHAPGRSTEPPNAADAPPSASAGTQPAEADAADSALESVLQQAGCGGISSFPLPLGNLDSLPVTCLPGVDIVVRPAASDRSGSSNAQAAASAAASAAARAGGERGEPPASDSPAGVAAGGATGPGPAAAPAAPAAGAPAEPRASSKKQPRGLGAGLKPRGLGADLKPRPRKPQDRRELPSASGGSSRAGPSRPESDAAAAARELPGAPGPPASRGGPPASGMGGSLSSLLEGLLGGGAPAGQVSGEGVAGAGGGGGHPLMQMLQNPQMQRMTESMMSSPAFQGAAEGLSRGEGRLDLGSIMQQMMPVVQDMLSGADASMLRQRRAAAQGSAPQSWRDGLSDAEVQRWEATLSRDARAQATASTPPPLSEAYLAGSVGSRRSTGLLDELRGPPAS